MLTTEQAAEYCQMKLSTFKYYAFVKKAVKGEMVGRVMMFQPADLDIFMGEYLSKKFS